MKIVRSSKCTTKHLTDAKRRELCRVLEEYGRVVNVFIDHFWELLTPPSKAELLKPIVDLPDTWLTARLRKVAAREALDMISSSREVAVSKREELLSAASRKFNRGKVNQSRKLHLMASSLEAVKPTHSGRTMNVSTTIANLREPKDTTEFDAWLEIRCVGEEVAIEDDGVLTVDDESYTGAELKALLAVLADLPTENVEAPGIWNDGGVLKVGTAQE